MKQVLCVLSMLLVACPAMAQSSSQAEELVRAAKSRTTVHVIYDGRYRDIDYPNGDVPDNIGVCTDLVIRSYRAIGIDLQQLVHEDMRANFVKYPSSHIWSLNKPDSNIDHRRVPNLQVFLPPHGTELPVSDNSEDYRAGDIVTWMLPGNLPHIGIVSDERDALSGVPLIVHNIGAGPTLENTLFRYRISGHYRYFPQRH